MRIKTFDLAEIATSLGNAFPGIDELWLFGSRRYRTRSPRSDIDIVIRCTDHIRPADLRAYSDMNCPALDLFLAHDGKAISVVNESSVEAKDFGQLVQRLEAVLFWSRLRGLETADIDWKIDIPLGIEFAMTALRSSEPFGPKWNPSVRHYFELLHDDGLPTQPYIGGNAQEISSFLVDVIRNAIKGTDTLNPKGKGWNFDFKTEYDYQNLFYSTVKPWLPNLGREEVTIIYDEQNKVSDFNLFGSQIVVEIKHISDPNTKATVAKTLNGLGDFYKRHPNIRVLINLVFVDKSVSLDDARWEKDYSYHGHEPVVITAIVRQG